MSLVVLAVGPAVLAMAGAWVAPSIARRASPRGAAVGLTALALTVSLVIGLLLCLAGALAAVALWPGLWPDDWTPGVVAARVPVPAPAGVVSGVAAVVLLVSAVGVAVRRNLASRAARKAARSLPSVDGLAIVDDPAIHAYAVPGRHACVVVSTGALRVLSAGERRAVLEHERSHLRHRHHVYAGLAQLAAAANPLVRPITRAVEVALEQWADADAARAVGDPRTVAHSLVKLARTAAPTPGAALGAASGAVVQRVRFLLQSPPPRRGTVALLAVAVGLAWACAVAVLLHVYDAIELSETVARR